MPNPPDPKTKTDQAPKSAPSETAPAPEKRTTLPPPAKPSDFYKSVPEPPLKKSDPGAY